MRQAGICAAGWANWVEHRCGRFYVEANGLQKIVQSSTGGRDKGAIEVQGTILQKVQLAIDRDSPS